MALLPKVQEFISRNHWAGTGAPQCARLFFSPRRPRIAGKKRGQPGVRRTLYKDLERLDISPIADILRIGCMRSAYRLDIIPLAAEVVPDRQPLSFAVIGLVEGPMDPE
jgi:hypothetical protein